MKATGNNWGFDLSGVDSSADPRNDFFRHANGAWLDTVEIPPDRSRWGSFEILAFENGQRLRAILEEHVSPGAVLSGSDERKVRDFYASGMDMERRNRDSFGPLADEIDRIAAAGGVRDFAGVLARLHVIGGNSLWYPDVDQDPKDSETMALGLFQGGLGLPDREYYLADDKKEIREKYAAHIRRMFLLLGESDDEADVESRFAVQIETALAKASWERERLRDIPAQCNYLTLGGLADLCPSLDWQSYFDTLGVDVSRPVIVGQLGFIARVETLLSEFPLEAWKAYFRWGLIASVAPCLSQNFIDEHFNFFGKVLTGQQEVKPLWERCASSANALLGEAIGALYVERHFSSEAREKIHALVGFIKQACEERIRRLDWMSERTKEKALEKLQAITWKLGHPDRWRDYSGLEIFGDTAYAINVLRARKFEARRQIAKIGKPVDQKEWHMSPSTVNASANHGLVEMVFPAGILQWPFFDPDADDAINFGAIGSVIGHELFHHFDDNGSQFDVKGNLHGWWTEEDRSAFQERSARLVEQFSGFTLLGRSVNGKLTLGENISDLGGVQLAFDAYQKSREGKPSLVLDGYTPEQRFFLGFAQVWRIKVRDELIAKFLVVDPHAPPVFRTNGSLANAPAFYEAFGVREGDGMHRLPEKRVAIW